MGEEFFEKAKIKDGVLLSYPLSGEPHIVIPEGITKIARNAFQDGYNLDTITLPNSVSEIEPNAFDNCCFISDFIISPDHPHFTFDGTALLSKDKTLLIWAMPAMNGDYRVPDSVVTICESAFDFCGITSVTIPGNVKVIRENAFDCCDLESATFLDGVTTIEKYAFSSCGDLTDLVLADSITTIGRGAFSLCEKLTDLVLPRGLTVIEDRTFSACYQLSTVVIQEGVTRIGDDAFCGCKNLTSITIPASVTVIGEWKNDDYKKLTVSAVPGSMAWNWAKEKGFPTKVLKPQPGYCPRCGSKLKGLIFKRCPHCK